MSTGLPGRLVPSGVEGRGLIRACWTGTGAFTATAAAATVSPDPMAVPMAVVSLGLLAAGCAAMLWAYQRALGRSRYELIGVGGLYFLAGCAPRSVRLSMMAALACEAAVALAAASVRPFTAAAFGILVPVYALGLSGAWGARHGTFPPRPSDSTTSECGYPSRNGDDV
ncbi:hypothetical protein [Candidatus Poriferisocius sp.]|uniref:hypothetical protein n=1 Tax=Candidatus Poriferisocius sp. TaxID=3101276 RepID=UPI003B02D0C6